MTKQFTRKYPFSVYLVGCIFLILFVAVIALIGVSYLAAEETLNENARSIRQQTEQNFITAFQTKKSGLRLYEDPLDKRMEETFGVVLAEYEAVGGDPSKMDLEAVKSDIGGDMELYVIDSNATVAYTTYSADLGLHFADNNPYFVEHLDEIRRFEGFFPDRIVTEISSPTFRKYACMPTPDHRFILELRLSGESVAYPREECSLHDEQIANEITRLNPYVENVRIFDVTLRQMINGTPVETGDEGLKQILATVSRDRNTLEFADPSSGNTLRRTAINPSLHFYLSTVNKMYGRIWRLFSSPGIFEDSGIREQIRRDTGYNQLGKISAAPYRYVS